jgi:hypothetical protein
MSTNPNIYVVRANEEPLILYRWLLLWILNKTTWQNGHYLLPLADALEPVEVFIRLPLHIPATTASMVALGQRAEYR